MKQIVVYVHGKGGSAEEAEHYSALFPDSEVLGFDYRAQTPWEARELFHPLGTQCVMGVQSVRAKARRKLMHLSLRLAFYIRIELRRNVSVKPNRA